MEILFLNLYYLKVNLMAKSYPDRRFIEQEIKRSGVRYTQNSSYIQIVCPFHRDTDPSLSISLVADKVPPGVWYCFSCREKGTWNKLAARMGLRLFGKEDSDTIFVAKSTKEIKEEIKESDLSLHKWEGSWRRYSEEFLKTFKVRRLRDMLNHVDYMYIPITYGGDVQGYARARLHKDDPGPKYWFSPKMVKPLYPIDYLLKQQSRVLVLVEGITDAWRFLRARIPTGALLGTNLLPAMVEQLEILEVATIILCMDGDRSGREAVKGRLDSNNKRIPGLQEKILKLGYKVIDYKLPKGIDPDEASVEILKDIRSLVREKGGVLCPKI
jgi:hypothetical protein